jgi:hypothetical protein
MSVNGKVKEHLKVELSSSNETCWHQNRYFLAKIDVNQDSFSCTIIQLLYFLNHELKNKIKNKILYHNWVFEILRGRNVII